VQQGGEVVLGFHEALGGGFLIPLGGLGRVGHQPPAVFIEQAKVVLGSRVTGFRRPAKRLPGSAVVFSLEGD